MQHGDKAWCWTDVCREVNAPSTVISHYKLIGCWVDHNSISECDGKQWPVQLEYRGRSEFCSEEILPKVILAPAAKTNRYEDDYCIHVFFVCSTAATCSTSL